jgi:hypothetical protein
MANTLQIGSITAQYPAAITSQDRRLERRRQDREYTQERAQRIAAHVETHHMWPSKKDIKKGNRFSVLEVPEKGFFVPAGHPQDSAAEAEDWDEVADDEGDLGEDAQWEPLRRSPSPQPPKKDQLRRRKFEVDGIETIEWSWTETVGKQGNQSVPQSKAGFQN